MNNTYLLGTAYSKLVKKNSCPLMIWKWFSQHSLAIAFFKSENDCIQVRTWSMAYDLLNSSRSQNFIGVRSFQKRPKNS